MFPSLIDGRANALVSAIKPVERKRTRHQSLNMNLINVPKGRWFHQNYLRTASLQWLHLPASVSWDTQTHAYTCFQQTLHAFLPPAVLAELAAHQTRSLLSALNTHKQSEHHSVLHRMFPHVICEFNVVVRAVNASEHHMPALWQSWNDGGCQPIAQTCEATATEYQRAAPTESEHRGTGGPRQMMVPLQL